MESVLNALHYAGIIFLVIMVFNLMILVHEWGHFLAARWRGLKVDKFQIWFGAPIWKKTYNGVQYGLGWIPAGGFVALPQMAPMEAIEGGSGEREQLPPISPLDKIIVAFAGPLFSFMLACLFAVVVFNVGKPEQEGMVTTTIGWVAPDSNADKGGLKPGDKILEIDGRPVKTFGGLVDSVRWNVVSSENNPIPFLVERPGEPKPLLVPVTAEIVEKEKSSFFSFLFKRKQLREVGIAGKQTPMVAGTQENSPAAEAGIQATDLITSVDGKELLSLYQLGDYIEKNPSKPLVLGILRDKGKPTEKQLTVNVTPRQPDIRPDDDKGRQLIGVIWDQNGLRQISHPRPWTQIRDALKTMGATISAIISRKSEINMGHLSGPIGIGRAYYTLLDDPYGLQRVLWFSVVLNVNLAVMNLLPFPVLDGGHITMALFEWIRRRPINIRILEVVQMACVFLLLGFMVFVSMKDAGDMVGSGGKGDKREPKQEYRFLPANQRQTAAPAPGQ